MPSIDPVSAACHRNPYPYYDHLLAGADLQFDTQLQLWVASRAGVIRQVLDSPDCAVRPSAEQVPKAIAGSSAGAVFALLMRMNEGAPHAQAKRAVQPCLHALNLSGIAGKTRLFAAQLAGDDAQFDAAALTRWMFDLPIYVIGDLLGFAADELPALAGWMSDFVRCLSPLSTATELQAASQAATALSLRFRTLLQSSTAESGSLVAGIRQQAEHIGWHAQEALVANLIGLLSQTYEATAGLIGNALVQLTLQSGLAQQLRAAPELLADFVAEVCRHDSPVQNTRRFVERETEIADVRLAPGAVILLLLGAANRDPAANPQPDRFLLNREQRRLFSFGHGRHACPGQELAFSIATAALQSLLQHSPPSLEQLAWSYRPSLNGRIPLFTDERNSP